MPAGMTVTPTVTTGQAATARSASANAGGGQRCGGSPGNGRWEAVPHNPRESGSLGFPVHGVTGGAAIKTPDRLGDVAGRSRLSEVVRVLRTGGWMGATAGMLRELVSQQLQRARSRAPSQGHGKVLN